MKVTSDRLLFFKDRVRQKLYRQHIDESAFPGRERRACFSVREEDIPDCNEIQNE